MDELVKRRRLIDAKLFNMVTTASKSRQPLIRALTRLIAEEREVVDRQMGDWRQRAEQAEQKAELHQSTIETLLEEDVTEAQLGRIH